MVRPAPASPTLVDPTAGPTTDAMRLRHLQEMANTDPAEAARCTWGWLKALGAPGRQHHLPALFAQGIAPDGPEGDCEGIVLGLFGSPWLVGLDGLVRLGRRLGGVGWTGKTFDLATGTGYNRLTASARIPALLATPRYRYERVDGELVGFHFHHSIDPSPLPPHAQVRAIRYDAPEHDNPLVLPRTRDELVQLVPGVHLGRALLRSAHDWRVVGWFALREPSLEA